MLEKIKRFFQDHSISTHSIVVCSTVVITMYYEVPPFQTYVLALYGAMPTWLKNLIAVFIACIAWYWRARRVWTAGERQQRLAAAQAQTEVDAQKQKEKEKTNDVPATKP